MSQRDKLLVKILLGTADANIAFEPLCQLLRTLGFDERVRGSHHIFSKAGIEEILNLQPKQGKAKAYQVKQIRNVILKYQLGGQDADQV
jgi:predicted RNA binding protein YcfA (HicA-like mRNA interferase family)